MSEIIRQCSNSLCRFRFPAPATGELGQTCPRCGSPAPMVATIRNADDDNPRSSQPPPGPAVEVLLDNIRSTFNVGAMFRTADGAGLQHLHLCGLTPTPEHPKVAKTALGAEHAVPWRYWPNALDAAEDAQQRGLHLWALEVSTKATSLFEIGPLLHPQRPILLIVGNEVSGVDPDLLARSERCIWIPMQGYKRSLNVAIAFGVIAYFLRYAAQQLDTNQ